MYDTYGEEFGDLIADIPDPAATPLRLMQDFLYVLDELGKKLSLSTAILAEACYQNQECLEICLHA